jgi:hypothetical protein
LYAVHIAVYFFIALYFTYIWVQKSDRLTILKQAKSIILLDIVMIGVGFFTDLILPTISTIMPTIFNLISIASESSMSSLGTQGRKNLQMLVIRD